MKNEQEQSDQLNDASVVESSVSVESPDIQPEQLSPETEPPTPALADQEPLAEPSDTVDPEPVQSFGALSTTEQPKASRNKRLLVVVAVAAMLLVVTIVVSLTLWLNKSVVNESVQNLSSDSITVQGAAITDIEGTVEYNNGGGWNAVKDWTEIEQTNQIRTLADSRAVITLDDGSAIRLDSNSIVTLTRLGNDEVIINNESGQIYTRVSPSDSRVFLVMVGEDEYRALGTAYKTINESEEKGVEVYQSKVQTNDDEQQPREVVEGQAFYTKHSEANKVGKLSSIDIDKLKNDPFVRWNHKKDLAEKEYADKLGVLVDIDKPRKQEEKPQPQPQPEPTPQPTSGISVSGVKTNDGIKVSWSVRGIDTSNGFKVVYSNSEAAPTYGKHSAQYVGAGTYATTIKLYDGKPWFIRVCAYRGEAGCANYSNTIKVTAPAKEVSKEKVTRGVMSTSLSGSKLSWSYSGKAPHGYKVTWSETPNPTYPDNNSIYVNGTSLDLSKKLGSKQGKYSVRVCAYTAGTESAKCVDYSSNVTY